MKHTCFRVLSCVAVSAWLSLFEGAAARADGVKPLSVKDAKVIRCGALAASPEGQACETRSGSHALLLEGDILGPEHVYQGGEVLVDTTGLIVHVGCSRDRPAALASLADKATRITCPEGVVSPGLINAHDHLTFDHNFPFPPSEAKYAHRNDWRAERDAPMSPAPAQVAWSEMRQNLVGTTSVVGAGGHVGFLRNLDSQQHPVEDDLLWDVFTTYPGVIVSDTFPLENPTDYLQHEADCSEYPYLGRLHSPSGLDAYVAHVAEGINGAAQNEFACLSSTDRNGVDLLAGKAFSMVHGIAINARDGDALARAGAHVVWSPRSNLSLYGNTAPVVMLKHQGVSISLGTDWTPSGSMHLGRELSCAAQLNETYFDRAFSDRELWSMVTSNPAKALRVSDKIGALKVGLFGDIAVYDGRGERNPYRAVIHADARSTLLVLRRSSLPFPFLGGPRYAGSIALYGDASVLSGMPNTLHESTAGVPLCESLDVCGTAKAVCPLRETWWTQLQPGLGAPLSLVAMTAANAASYPLFSCGVPVDEPSCVPARPGEYDGVVRSHGQDKDRDGDGIRDDEDNCRDVFNPIRPMDDGVQADADADGAGDACDLHPLTRVDAAPH